MMHLAAGSPQTDLQQWRLPTDFYVEPKRKPPRITYVPLRTYTRSKQKSPRNPGPPHKHNYDQRGSPQAELRAGRLPTSIITTRDLPTARITPGTWLANWRTEIQPGNLSRAWLADWLGGWLASGLKLREAQGGMAGGLAGWWAEAQKNPNVIGGSLVTWAI